MCRLAFLGCLIAGFLTLAVSVHAEDLPHLLRTVSSPLGDMEIQYYRTGAETNEIWLSLKDQPERRQLLYRYGRDAEVLMAPDETWLVVNDAAGSDIAEVHLFEQVANIIYAEVPKGLHESVWKLFKGTQHAVTQIEFFHTYTRVVRWAPHSQAVLVEIWGDGGLKRPNGDGTSFVFVGPWLCVYDVKKERASLDLSWMNKNVVHPPQEHWNGMSFSHTLCPGCPPATGALAKVGDTSLFRLKVRSCRVVVERLSSAPPRRHQGRGFTGQLAKTNGRCLAPRRAGSSIG